MPAPEGAAETPLDQEIRANFPSPFPGLCAPGFLDYPSSLRDWNQHLECVTEFRDRN
jgi:hypothetical protein